MSVAVFKDVVKSYGRIEALRGVTFRIPKSCMVGLIGPNGAGKTTTLKIAMGLIRRDYGYVEVLGYDPWLRPDKVRQFVGFLPEDPPLPSVKVYDLLKCVARLKGIRSYEYEVSRVSSMLGIRQYLDISANKLSRGYKQRVALALALIGEPKILLLDEPTTNLDPRSRLEVLELLRNLVRDYGVSVLISTHILAEAQEYLDYMIVLSRGVVVAEGSVVELATRFGQDIKMRCRIPRGIKLEEMIKDLEDELRAVEERIKIHKIFRKYAFQGTPDVRVIVFNKVPIMAMLRLPTKESHGKANLHQGAVGVGIDMATGITTYGVVHSQPIRYLPGTKRKLNGIKIPFWNEILRLSVRIQEVIPSLGFLGVDFVIDRERGPMVLELNARPGLSIQIANRAGLRRRLNL